MADLAAITAIQPGSQSTRKLDVKFGELCAFGDLLYEDKTTGKYKKTDADLSLAAATIAGICLVGGALDSWGVMATNGPVILTGPTLVTTEVIFASGTPGKMMPDSDLTSGDWVGQVGMPTSTQVLDIAIKNFGHQI